MVMDMLVPVSPSGTGKMFMSLTCFLCLAMLLEPEMMAFFSWLPKIMGYTSFLSSVKPRPAWPGISFSYFSTGNEKIQSPQGIF